MKSKRNFIALAHKKMDIEINRACVRKCLKDNAPVQIMFANIWCKNTCFERKNKLKGTSMLISEDLSPEDEKLFYEARKMKKEEKISATWTNKNVICVKTGHSSISMTIKNIQHLKEMIKSSKKSTSQLYYDAVETDSNDNDEKFNRFVGLLRLQ